MELQSFDQQMLDGIMEEYIETMNVVYNSSFWNNNYISHVPSIFDVVQVFGKIPAEHSFGKILEIAYAHRIFLNTEKGFINMPIVEVW
jgi:hypothetical protein